MQQFRKSHTQYAHIKLSSLIGDLGLCALGEYFTHGTFIESPGIIPIYTKRCLLCFQTGKISRFCARKLWIYFIYFGPHTYYIYTIYYTLVHRITQFATHQYNSVGGMHA